MANLKARSNIFNYDEAKELDFAEGTIQEFYDSLEWPESVKELVVAVYNGEIVDDWSINVKGDDTILFVLRPAGDNGKSTLALIASIAVMIFAPYAGAAIHTTLGVSEAVATAIVGVAGSLIIGAIFRPPVPKSHSSKGDDSPFFQITGTRNQASPYGPIPRLYGQVRMYPIICAEPISITSNGKNTFIGLYDCGYGQLNMNPAVINARIGDTPIEDLTSAKEVEVVYHDYVNTGVYGSSRLQFYKNDFHSEAVNAELLNTTWPTTPPPTNNDPKIIERYTDEAAEGVIIDLYFPEGLVRTNADGQIRNATVGLALARKNDTLGTPWENYQFSDIELQLGPESEVDSTLRLTEETTSNSVSLLMPVLYSSDDTTPSAGVITNNPNLTYEWTTENGATITWGYDFDVRKNVSKITATQDSSYARYDYTVPGTDPSIYVNFSFTITASSPSDGQLIRIDAVDKDTRITFSRALTAYAYTTEKTFTYSFQAPQGSDILFRIYPDRDDIPLYLRVSACSIVNTSASGGPSGLCGPLSDVFTQYCGGYPGFTDEVYIHTSKDVNHPIQAGNKLKLPINPANPSNKAEYLILEATEIPDPNVTDPDKMVYLCRIQGWLQDYSVKSASVSSWNGKQYILVDARHIEVLKPGFYLTAKKTKPFGISLWLGLQSGSYTNWPAAKWGIRLAKTSEENERLARDTIMWQLLRSTKNTGPINLETPHAMVELRADATNKLSGSIDTLSLAPQSILPNFNSNGSYVGYGPSANPARVYIDILIGNATRFPVPQSLIDWPSLYSWMQFCYQHNYQFNAVITWQGTTLDILETVCNVGKGTFHINDGKYSVIWDDPASGQNPVPVQLITPQNSWGFSAAINYPDLPHAIKAPFKNAELDWQDDVAWVYQNGYNKNNASKIEEIEIIGITYIDHLQELLHYYMAQTVLQRESCSVQMDIENLVVQRGDIVELAHDVFKIGGQSLRVTKVIDSSTFEVDQFIGNDPNTAVKLRLANGTLTAELSAHRHSTIENRIILDNPYSGIKEGDLAVWGFTSVVTGLFKVKNVIPSSDLTATIELLEHNDQLYNWTGGVIPPHEPIGGGIPASRIGPPTNTNAEFIKRIENRYWVGTIHLSWSPPLEGSAAIYEIVEIVDGNWTPRGSTSNNFFDIELNEIYSDTRYFKIRSISVRGNTSHWTQFPTLAIEPDTTPPPDIESFTANTIMSQNGIYLQWTFPALDVVPDLDHFKIKFSDTSNSDWNFNNQYEFIVPYNKREFITPNLFAGTYYIKAVDTAGNESVNALLVISEYHPTGQILKNVRTETLIDHTLDYDVLSYIVPTKDCEPQKGTVDIIGGSKVGDFVSCAVEKNGENSGIILHYYDGSSAAKSRPIAIGGQFDPIPDMEQLCDQHNPIGYSNKGTLEFTFYTNNLFDSEPCLLSTDITLGMKVNSGSIDPSKITAHIWFKTWDIYTSQEEIDAMMWRKITSDPVTLKVLYKFLIVLETNILEGTPIVWDAVVNQSFEARVEHGADEIITDAANGLTITFSAPFKEPPTVNITAESLSAGDEWVITKTTSDFNIKFMNNGTPITATFDWTAIGFGGNPQSLQNTIHKV